MFIVIFKKQIICNNKPFLFEKIHKIKITDQKRDMNATLKQNEIICESTVYLIPPA